MRKACPHCNLQHKDHDRCGHKSFAGYDFRSSGTSPADYRNKGTIIQRGSVDTSRRGDYGADPLGDGTFRMVPSGDVVDYAERCRRLGRK